MISAATASRNRAAGNRRRPRPSDDDPADVLGAGERQELLRDMALDIEGHHLGAERLGEAEGVGNRVSRRLGSAWEDWVAT